MSRASKKGKRVKRSEFMMKLADTFATTSKQLIWLFSINGILWIWCSYILAFIGKDQIAESLSSSVCTIVIGQMGCYLVTKTVENVFQYNEFNFSKPKQTSKEETQNGTQQGPDPGCLDSSRVEEPDDQSVG